MSAGNKIVKWGSIILCWNEKMSKNPVQNCGGWLNLNSTFKNYSKVYAFPLIM